MGLSVHPALTNWPSGKLTLSDIQSNLVDVTPTKVLLDVVPAVYTDGIENIVNHRITPGRAGFYSIVGQVEFTNSIIANKYYAAYIYVNGTRLVRHNAHSGIGNVLSVLCSLPNHYLTAEDYIELWAMSGSGDDTVDISGGGSFDDTFLSVQRVR